MTSSPTFSKKSSPTWSGSQTACHGARKLDLITLQEIHPNHAPKGLYSKHFISLNTSKFRKWISFKLAPLYIIAVSVLLNWCHAMSISSESVERIFVPSASRTCAKDGLKEGSWCHIFVMRSRIGSDVCSGSAGRIPPATAQMMAIIPMSLKRTTSGDRISAKTTALL